MVLGLLDVDVHGFVDALADLALISLCLQPLQRHRLAGHLQHLQRMPLQQLYLQDCDVEGPMGTLGTLPTVVLLTIRNARVRGSLHTLFGLTDPRIVRLAGLDLSEGLQPLSSDLSFAAQTVELTKLSISGTSPPLPSFITRLGLNGITKGNLKGINLPPGSPVNLLQSSFTCPIVRPNGTTVLTEDCQEHVILLVILFGLAMLIVGAAGCVLRRNTDITVQNKDSAGAAWAMFVLSISVDLTTDIIANSFMLLSLNVEDVCTPFNHYERLKHILP